MRPHGGLPTTVLLLGFWLAVCGKTGAAPTDFRTAFSHPPDSARPWVYWTWIDGNVTKEGITADLEAMQRVGLGGALILDVSQGTPPGPVRFFGKEWQELLRHAVDEAKRLGLELNVNNGPGYYGSGGPWIPHDRAMQTVVESEVHLVGGRPWTGILPRPVPAAEYRDVAVIAIEEGVRARYQMPDFVMKSLQWKGWVGYRGTQSSPLDAVAPPDAIIPVDHVVDLSRRMAEDGSLTWNVPAGEWTVIRFGHAWNGHVVGPSRPGDEGPETDKLDKAATKLHFNAFVQRLSEMAGPASKDVLVATHIDSWEGGGQNWTAAMRGEFRRRRGYDPIPYLPILTGRILGDLQMSERFLFDLRKTVSELMIENYTAEFQRLAHSIGLRDSFESYTTIGDDIDSAAFVDEPMAEFWTPNGQGADFYPTIKAMSSAAHLNGIAIVGAESFTSGSREKFLWHPAMIKALADDAFCGGVNRFVIHRYAAQPFAPRVAPGMQMGPWGLHYERTNTWWNFSEPWHKYLTRCQYMLRQGRYVADVLKLESEEPLRRFQDINLEGFSYDACGPGVFFSAHVDDGRISFPSGAKYRLVILPNSGTMSVPLLTRIRDLIKAGASVLGEPPQRTPGLTNYPAADHELNDLVAEIWGSDPSATSHALGRGRIYRGIAPEMALADRGISPDFVNSAGLKFIHRTVQGSEIYFLSHAGSNATVATCTFRITGQQPELWDAVTGRIAPLRAYADTGRGTTISIPFDPDGSVFVVFGSSAPRDPLAKVVWNGVTVMENGVYTDLQPGTEPVFDLIAGDIRESGTFLLSTTTGRSREFVVESQLGPEAVKGPWQVEFSPGPGSPITLTWDHLMSWSACPIPAVKYFSGTALYTSLLTIPNGRPDRRLLLELGRVEVMADVRLNGKDLGILWKPPYSVDITEAATTGANRLEIRVVNLWVNRLIGDEQLPEDSERNANGLIKEWPQWLLDGRNSPTGRQSFSSWRLWKGDDPLQDSGLLGPVTIRSTVRVAPDP